jgi:hypothetical protein
MDCLDPQGDLIMFYDEDNSQESLIWSVGLAKQSLSGVEIILEKITVMRNTI